MLGARLGIYLTPKPNTLIFIFTNFCPLFTTTTNGCVTNFLFWPLPVLLCHFSSFMHIITGLLFYFFLERMLEKSKILRCPPFRLKLKMFSTTCFKFFSEFKWLPSSVSKLNYLFTRFLFELRIFFLYYTSLQF